VETYSLIPQKEKEMISIMISCSKNFVYFLETKSHIFDKRIDPLFFSDFLKSYF